MRVDTYHLFYKYPTPPFGIYHRIQNHMLLHLFGLVSSRVLALQFSVGLLLCTPSLLSGQNKSVIDSLLQLVAQPQTTDSTLVRAYNDLGIQYAISDPAKAKAYIQQAFDLVGQTRSTRGLAGANNCMGVVHFYQKEYDSAIFFFQEALRINQELGHLWGQGAALNQLGMIHTKLQNHKQAIQYLEEAGHFFLLKKDTLAYAKTLENIHASYQKMASFGQATNYLIRSVDLYEKLGDLEGKARGQYHLGVVEMLNENHSDALRLLKRGLASFEQIGHIKNIIETHKKVAQSYTKLKVYDSAILHYELILDIAEQKAPKMRSASIHSRLGELYQLTGQIARAIAQQRRAQSLLKTQPKSEKKESFTALHSLGELYLKQGQTDSAYLFAHQARNLSEEINFLYGKVHSIELLAKISEQKGDSAGALRYYKALPALEDSLQVWENRERVAELHAQFQTQQKDKKIKELEAEKERNAKSKWLMTGLVFLLSILIGVAIYYNGKRQRKTRKEVMDIKGKLKHKTKALKAKTIHLMNKKQVIDEVREKVAAIDTDDVMNKDYRQLLNTIKLEQKEEQEWEQFETTFDQLSEDFYEQLKIIYPCMSPNEMRMASMLRMNLSNKEIARVQNITVEGVRKAKYRLRKKLGVQTNDELLKAIVKV